MNVSFRRLAVAAAILAFLVWLLVREASVWAAFDWAALGRQLRNVHLPFVVCATVLIYAAYGLRALRWKFMLQPQHPAGFASVLRATIIGFAAVALLGRPAELVRPYLIARQEGASMGSQLAIWTVERIFDAAACALLVAAALLTPTSRSGLPYLDKLRSAGAIFGVAVALAAFGAVVAARYRSPLQVWLERVLRRLSPVWAERAAELTSEIAGGVRALHDVATLAIVTALSLLMWATIAGAYLAVTHAFPQPLGGMDFSSVLLLMAFGLLGSLVQLPGGGTSQLMVVAALVNVFRVPAELSVSCGIVLWLGTYMAPVPVGLALLRREHLSLRVITRGTESPAFEKTPIP